MRRPVLFIVVATLAILLAVGTAAGVAAQTDSNETTVDAGIQGTTATNVSVPADDTTRSTVAAELGVDERAVRIESDTIEVRAGNVSASDLRSALRAAGLDTSTATVRERVTERTQRETVTVLRERLDQAGIDATVQKIATDAGDRGVRITTTADRRAVVENSSFQGRVEFVAHFPDDGGYREVTLLTNEDFVTVGSAQPGRAGRSPYVPVTLTTEAARNYADAMQTFGFTQEGVGNCPTATARENPENASGYCLYTVSDGQVLYAAQMSAGLAEQLESGGFVEEPQFIITAENISKARELSLSLRAGALPAPLEFGAISDTAVQNETTETPSTDAPGTTSSGDGPGFTPILALVALVVLGAGGARRR